MAGHPLRPATDHRLGRPLPHQLANPPQVPPKAPEGFPGCFANQPAHAVLPTISGGYPPPRGRSPTCSSPVRHVSRPKATPSDLHALGTPPALILSQDQTLHQISNRLRRHLPVTPHPVHPVQPAPRRLVPVPRIPAPHHRPAAGWCHFFVRPRHRHPPGSPPRLAGRLVRALLSLQRLTSTSKLLQGPPPPTRSTQPVPPPLRNRSPSPAPRRSPLQAPRSLVKVLSRVDGGSRHSHPAH